VRGASSNIQIRKDVATVLEPANRNIRGRWEVRDRGGGGGDLPKALPEVAQPASSVEENGKLLGVDTVGCKVSTRNQI